MLQPDPESVGFPLQHDNFQIKIWYDFTNPDLPPSALDNGWQLKEVLTNARGYDNVTS